jgi:hypothetical protein
MHTPDRLEHSINSNAFAGSKTPERGKEGTEALVVGPPATESKLYVEYALGPNGELHPVSTLATVSMKVVENADGEFRLVNDD